MPANWFLSVSGMYYQATRTVRYFKLKHNAYEVSIVTIFLCVYLLFVAFLSEEALEGRYKSNGSDRFGSLASLNQLFDVAVAHRCLRSPLLSSCKSATLYCLTEARCSQSVYSCDLTIYANHKQKRRANNFKIYVKSTSSSNLTSNFSSNLITQALLRLFS